MSHKISPATTNLTQGEATALRLLAASTGRTQSYLLRQIFREYMLRQVRQGKHVAIAEMIEDWPAGLTPDPT